MTTNDVILEKRHTNLIFVATDLYLVMVFYGHRTTSIVIQDRSVADTVPKRFGIGIKDTWDGCQSALVVHGDLHPCRSIMHIGSQGNHDSCNPGVQEWNLWLKWQYYDSPVDWKKDIPELLGLLNDDNDVLYFLEHLFMNDLDLKRLFLRDLRLSKYIFLAIEHFLTCQVLFHVLKKMHLPSPQR